MTSSLSCRAAASCALSSCGGVNDAATTPPNPAACPVVPAALLLLLPLLLHAFFRAHSPAGSHAEVLLTSAAASPLTSPLSSLPPGPPTSPPPASHGEGMRVRAPRSTIQADFASVLLPPAVCACSAPRSKGSGGVSEGGGGGSVGGSVGGSHREREGPTAAKAADASLGSEARSDFVCGMTFGVVSVLHER